MLVSDTAEFCVACSAAVDPVVILDTSTFIPNAGNGFLGTALYTADPALAIGAYSSTKYCGTTNPVKAPVPTSLASNSWCLLSLSCAEKSPLCER